MIRNCSSRRVAAPSYSARISGLVAVSAASVVASTVLATSLPLGQGAGSIIRASALESVPSAVDDSVRSSASDIAVDQEQRARAVSRDAERRPEVVPTAPRSEIREFEAANDRLGRQADRRAAAKMAASRWVLPVASYRKTAGFGQVSGLWSRAHTGVDFAAPTGTGIRSVAAGTVVSAGSAGAYGLRTVVQTKSGEELWYCHQSSIRVRAGDAVAAGQLIGAVGATGNVTGSHLHLEIHIAGTPTDPEQALRARGLSP